MPADNASVLGIFPPCSVHIAYDGQQDDWPYDMVTVLPNRIVVSDPVVGQPLVYYRYHYGERVEGEWRFVSPDDDFTVRPGPIPELSMDTAEPQ